ncbi:MAG: FtsX-like permease family protein [Xanthomonadaceae bacterium]|nr:FtsX-like permease family protein [Xanthomonadaceae bacterium]
MKALSRKALRDLWHLRGQALAIALVIAGGIANLVMSQATLDSLYGTRERFYRENAFADAWAPLERAPESVAARLAAIDGVAAVETRVVSAGNLALEGFDEPIRALVHALPPGGVQPALNRLTLRAGRLPDGGGRGEVVASEAFAEAHGLRPGARLRATLNGRAQWFTMVGVAASPEFIYQIQPGSTFPDFRRFAILWMDRRELEAALDMDGAFNDVALRLAPGANTAAVLDAIDRVLARYGGLGAFAREEQLSHRFLMHEFRQLGTMAWLFPAIFLSVAAFLLNVVVTRLVGMQRDQIAILKAFGYPPAAIGRHYALMVALIALGGTAVGIAGGALLGEWLSGVYMQFYRFPYLEFRLSPAVAGLGVAVALSSALAGTAVAVLRAARLPPAEAMRPPAPEHFRPTLVERLGLGRRLDEPTRIILRQLERRPGKALLSVLGLAMACAIMMVGRFQGDAIDWMVDTQYRIAQRNDVGVYLVEPTGRGALRELGALPGVTRVEPFRTVPVVFRRGTVEHRSFIEGLVPAPELRRPVDRALRAVPIPTDGVLLTDYLAGMLGVVPGDRIEVQVLDGRRRWLVLPVAGTVHEYIGAQGYMALDALNRALGEGDVVTGARLSVAASGRPELYRLLDERPRIAGVAVRELEIRNVYDSIAESMLTFSFVSLLLGAVINFGVVYNAARVALSERGRELASLRVLGFTRAEVSYILLGELALLVLASVPIGFLLGWGLIAFMGNALTSDLFRVPAHVSAQTLAFAGLAMLVSSVLSALVVRRRVARLDLVEVLKTRE